MKKVIKSTKTKSNASKEPVIYILKLYITGSTVQSQKALTNIKKVCEEHLKNRYKLQVIDIHQCPGLAKDDQIIAVPTLVKKMPDPLRRFIGDLSDESSILFGLDIKPHQVRKKKVKSK